MPKRPMRLTREADYFFYSYYDKGQTPKPLMGLILGPKPNYKNAALAKQYSKTINLKLLIFFFSFPFFRQCQKGWEK